MTAVITAPSTATVFGRPVLPATEDGRCPFWRLVLRGCSQCCFQTNEITGVLFLLAVLAYDWKQFLLMAMGALIGAGVGSVLMRNDRALLELGLFGFNSILMAIGLGNFFDKTVSLWIWAAVMCTLAAGLTWVFVKWFPYPVLAAPFILLFWVFWPVSDDLGLTKLQFPPFIGGDVHFVRAAVSALGATLFAGVVVAGILFFVGLLVSNWRHAALAVSAAMIAHTIAEWWNVPGDQINSGLAGLNAVLAAVAIYALVAQDIRLSLLGAIVASAVLPLFGQLDLISLAAGFVLTTWAILFLDWFQKRWFNQPVRTLDPPP
jgi:urea transporter